MDAETENVTNDAEKPKKLEEALAKPLVRLHAKIVKQAELHFSKMEETATCESDSDAQPCLLVHYPTSINCPPDWARSTTVLDRSLRSNWPRSLASSLTRSFPYSTEQNCVELFAVVNVAVGFQSRSYRNIPWNPV
jgi:hypothetical protein